ncbi:MAG: fibronectin type III domain-containing protein [Spartobacteria bacterium]|nr:fibronectin type III domain-containing protein [Spartobacteria bacterium]
MKTVMRCLALVLVFHIFPGAVPAQVTIEIVNESGWPDTNVFIKAPGRLWTGVTEDPVTPMELFVNIALTNPAHPTTVPLSWLAAEGSVPPYTNVSTISGNTNLVYSFRADYIKSGSIYFFYGRNFTFTDQLQPSPPPGTISNAYRYDYTELTIKNTDDGNNAVDMTYVDKFGIPVQMEWFRDGELVSASHVYASTRTLVDRFNDSELGEAVYALTDTDITPGWAYAGPDSYTNFARILAPQKIDGSGTDVVPYPDISGYLNSLTGTAHQFQLNVNSDQGGYHYIGYVVDIDAVSNGWQVTSRHTTNLPPYNPLRFPGADYTNTVTFTIPATGASQYVYGSPVGPNKYEVNGMSVTTDVGVTYAVEVWMIGDILSSLNFGFWGGRYGTNSAVWFTPIEWQSFPFGLARIENDGYYNLYTALLYNNADPYGYAFSERITPDVLMSPGNGDTVRITLLPDDRLDTPVVTPPPTNLVTSDAIPLDWTLVVGATGYLVNVTRPLGIPSATCPAASNSYTLDGLQPGTPYRISVQAMGTGAYGNAVITPGRTVVALTAGETAARTGAFTQVQATFNAADPYYQVKGVRINGMDLIQTNDQWLTTNDVPARWIASTGVNQVVVSVLGADGEAFFNDWLTFEITSLGSDRAAISNVFLYGQKLSEPAPGITGFIDGTATNFQASTLNPSLSIGLSFVPAETRRYSPLPMPFGFTDIGLTDDQRVRFSFNVPVGETYRVASSTNLVTWETNYTGVGRHATDTYTNAPGGPAFDCYRIER